MTRQVSRVLVGRLVAPCVAAWALSTAGHGPASLAMPAGAGATHAMYVPGTAHAAAPVEVLRDERIRVGATERAYRLAVPASAAGGSAADANAPPLPVVYAFHGLGGSMDQLALSSGLDRFAADHGALVVYPNGVNRRWIIVAEWAAEDFAFFDALHARLTARYRIDPTRVYLTGMSNGAFFSHLLASRRPRIVAAIAPHSGGLGQLSGADLDVTPKYAVMIIHGTADRIVRVEEARRAAVAYRRWGHEVEVVEVPGLGHTWAHGAGINARMWRFFEDHGRR